MTEPLTDAEIKNLKRPEIYPYLLVEERRMLANIDALKAKLDAVRKLPEKWNRQKSIYDLPFWDGTQMPWLSIAAYELKKVLDD